MNVEGADAACPEKRVWKDYLTRNLERTPVAKFHFVAEPMKGTLVARFNNVNPPTAYAPDRIGYFSATPLTDGSSISPRGPAATGRDDQMAVLVFITAGCIDYAGPVPVDALAEMLRPPR